MKITVCFPSRLWTGYSNHFFPPQFPFLPVISFISDVFDHYYAAPQTVTRTWLSF